MTDRRRRRARRHGRVALGRRLVEGDDKLDLVDAGHFTWEDGAHQYPEIVTGWWTGGHARA
jgi:hypothetical protein